MTGPIRIIAVGDRPRWQPPRGQLFGPTAAVVLLSAIFVAFGLSLTLDRVAAVSLLGVSILAAFACGVWMLLAHMLLPRSGVVRAQLTDEGVRFGGAPGIRIPLLLLAPIGLVMLGAWLWALVTASERLTVLTIVLVPVLALLLMYGGGRAIFGAPAAHSLDLTPQGVRLRIPRNDLVAAWDEVRDAEVGRTHVTVRATDGRAARWATRDLGSDPVVLADLIALYASTPSARGEIGPATLARWDGPSSTEGLP